MKHNIMHYILIAAVLFSTFLFPLNVNAASEQPADSGSPTGDILSIPDLPQGPRNQPDSDYREFIFDNRTGEAPVTITVNGPIKETFTLKAGKNKVKLPEGSYQYSYKACKRTFTGYLEVIHGTFNRLYLSSCPVGSTTTAATGELITITVVNETGARIRMVFQGKTNYTFMVEGSFAQVRVLAGRYRVRVFGCRGGAATKENITKSMTWSYTCRDSN